MKKRMIAFMLCMMLLIPACAAAEQMTPMDAMFVRLKDALILLSLDEYDQALETLRFVFDVECRRNTAPSKVRCAIFSKA